MKKNKKLLIYLNVFFVVLFIAVGLFVWERQVYNDALVEKAYEVFPSNENRTGIVFKVIDHFETLDGSVSKKDVYLMPGDEVERYFFIKNHHLSTQVISFVNFDDFNEEKGPGLEIIFPEGDSFVLKPGEWRIVKYLIRASEDIKDGDYFGKIVLRNQDEIQYSESLKIVYGIGNEYNVFVSFEEKELNYVLSIDPALNPHKFAMQYVYSDLKKMSGFIFAFLALVFLYKAVLYDRTKTKGKKR